MEEKRRRAERNENILRTLERIDYQASILAAKTERLKLLKVEFINIQVLVGEEKGQKKYFLGIYWEMLLGEL